jgi:hypothetical protein
MLANQRPSRVEYADSTFNSPTPWGSYGHVIWRSGLCGQCRLAEVRQNFGSLVRITRSSLQSTKRSETVLFHRHSAPIATSEYPLDQILVNCRFRSDNAVSLMAAAAGVNVCLPGQPLWHTQYISI